MYSGAETFFIDWPNITINNVLFADECVVLLGDVCSVADSIVSFCVCANESVIVVCAIWFLCVAACWRVTVTVRLVFMGSDCFIADSFVHSVGEPGTGRRAVLRVLIDAADVSCLHAWFS